MASDRSAEHDGDPVHEAMEEARAHKHHHRSKHKKHKKEDRDRERRKRRSGSGDGGEPRSRSAKAGSADLEDGEIAPPEGEQQGTAPPEAPSEQRQEGSRDVDAPQSPTEPSGNDDHCRVSAAATAGDARERGAEADDRCDGVDT